MKYLNLLIIILALFSFACGGSSDDGTDGSSGSNGTDGVDSVNVPDDDGNTDDGDGSDGTPPIIITLPAIDSTSDTPGDLVTFNGKVQDMTCLPGGTIDIYPLDDDLYQEGFAYRTDTFSVFGKYLLTARVTNRYFEIYADVSCRNENTGDLMDTKSMAVLIDRQENERNNINPATSSIKKPTRRFFRNDQSPTYQDFTASKRRATRLFRENIFNTFGITGSFSDMSIDGTSDAHALQLAIHAVLLKDKSVPEQLALLSDIENDLVDATADNQNVIDLIKEGSMSVNIMSVIDIVKDRYAQHGVDLDPPKFWRFLDSDGDGVLNRDDPDSFIDLIERTPILQYTKNIEPDSICSIDTSDFNWFAVPGIFNGAISASKYIGMDGQGDNLYIYSNKFDVYDLPDVNILLVTKVQDNFFTGDFQDITGDTFSNLPSGFHGNLGDHSLESGVKYWRVFNSDESYAFSKSCNSDLLPFGRVLFSDDGINWNGMTNNTSFFRRGLKMFLTD